MSSRAISGRPGGGKSLYSVMLLLRELEETERPIVTNLPLRLENIIKYCVNTLKRPDIDVCGRIQLLTDDQVPEFWRYRGNGVEPLPPCSNDEWKRGERPAFDRVTEGVCYFLDEVHDFLNSRNWQTTGNACLYYISKHRHLGDDVFWITQSVKNVDSQFRSVTQDYTYCRNFSKEKFRGFTKGKYFTATTYLEPQTRDRSSEDPQEGEKFRLDKKIARCYWTSKQKLAADSGKVARGWSVKWLFVGIGGCCVIAIIVVWFAPHAIIGFVVKTGEKPRLAAEAAKRQMGAPFVGGVVGTNAPSPVSLGAPLSTPDLRPTGPPVAEIFNVGVALNSLTSAEVCQALASAPLPGSGQVSVRPSPFGNAVIVTGTSFQNVTAVAETVRLMDIPRPAMVMLQAVILRTTKGRSSNIGVWHTLQDVVSDGGFGLGNVAFDPFAGLVTFGSITAAQEVIRIMGSQNVGRYGFTVESRPVLAAASGQEAWFTSGREVPVPVTTQNVANAQTSVQFKKVQFSFGVTPSVLPSGRIALKITQSNDDIVGSAEVGGNTVPTIATQSLTTRIELQEGQVAVLGGISLKNEGDDSNSFPILGAIPPLSWVLGNRDKRREESELLVVITAFRVPEGANPLPVRRAEPVKKEFVPHGTDRTGEESRKKQQKKGKAK